MTEDHTLSTTNVVGEIKNNSPTTSYPIAQMNIEENSTPTTVHHPQKTEIKQDYMMTGLSDYGFWSQQVKEEVAARKEPEAPFRRGRIWA